MCIGAHKKNAIQKWRPPTQPPKIPRVKKSNLKQFMNVCFGIYTTQIVLRKSYTEDGVISDKN